MRSCARAHRERRRLEAKLFFSSGKPLHAFFTNFQQKQAERRAAAAAAASRALGLPNVPREQIVEEEWNPSDPLPPPPVVFGSVQPRSACAFPAGNRVPGRPFRIDDPLKYRPGFDRTTEASMPLPARASSPPSGFPFFICTCPECRALIAPSPVHVTASPPQQPASGCHAVVFALADDDLLGDATALAEAATSIASTASAEDARLVRPTREVPSPITPPAPPLLISESTGRPPMVTPPKPPSPPLIPLLRCRVKPAARHAPAVPATPRGVTAPTTSTASADLDTSVHLPASPLASSDIPTAMPPATSAETSPTSSAQAAVAATAPAAPLLSTPLTVEAPSSPTAMSPSGPAPPCHAYLSVTPSLVRSVSTPLPSTPSSANFPSLVPRVVSFSLVAPRLAGLAPSPTLLPAVRHLLRHPALDVPLERLAIVIAELGLAAPRVDHALLVEDVRCALKAYAVRAACWHPRTVVAALGEGELHATAGSGALTTTTGVAEHQSALLVSTGLRSGAALWPHKYRPVSSRDLVGRPARRTAAFLRRWLASWVRTTVAADISSSAPPAPSLDPMFTGLSPASSSPSPSPSPPLAPPAATSPLSPARLLVPGTADSAPTDVPPAGTGATAPSLPGATGNDQAIAAALGDDDSGTPALVTAGRSTRPRRAGLRSTRDGTVGTHPAEGDAASRPMHVIDRNNNNVGTVSSRLRSDDAGEGGKPEKDEAEDEEDGEDSNDDSEEGSESEEEAEEEEEEECDEWSSDGGGGPASRAAARASKRARRHIPRRRGFAAAYGRRRAGATESDEGVPNAVVVQGEALGAGKSALVYACAEELGSGHVETITWLSLRLSSLCRNGGTRLSLLSAHCPHE